METNALTRMMHFKDTGVVQHTLLTSFYVIAEIAGEIAGTLTFSTGKRPRLLHAGEFGMTVLRRYWNLGIGSRMLAYLIDWARQTGTIRKINLRVRVDNLPAIHLYEKFGFVQEGRLTREFYRERPRKPRAFKPGMNGPTF